MSLTIYVNDLEQVLQQCLTRLREECGETITLTEPLDYYWTLNDPEKYNPAIEPIPTLGQLTWDLELVQELKNGELEPVSVNLVKLGEILTALGYKTLW